ncbi:uncharacterized protein LOC119457079 isoform X2 [Dermacentor silvarum]|uniref:uncharacterized protein LOC119457079 isoform X2 n=1 Tax=Dermacentor silvarum TaxID=543639 RepID=UPI0021014ED0|nr:uncharacterized protein LOC119457079 isoform X2 [Dermacentor silvarum]
MKMGKIRQISLIRRARNGTRRKPGQQSIRRRLLNRGIACLVWLCGVLTAGFPVLPSCSGFLMTTGFVMGGSCYQFLHFRDRPSIQTMASVCFNCRLGMLTFIWWNSFRIFLEVLTIVGVGLWKGTSENFTLIMSFLSCLGLTLLVQGFFTRRVFHYSSLVRPGVRIHAHGEMMPSAMALVEPGPTVGHVGGKEGDEESTETKTAHRTSESRNVTDSTKREPGPNGGEQSSTIIKKSPPE